MSGRNDIAQRIRRVRETGSGMQRDDVAGPWPWWPAGTVALLVVVMVLAAGWVVGG